MPEKKKCKKCPNLFTAYDTIRNLCEVCLIEKTNQKPLSAYKPIKRASLKKVSSKNKNTPAKFSQKTKDEIKARDKICIISGDPIEEYHHSFFGAIQANFGEDRNEHYEGVGLSAKVHYIIHHGKDTKLAKQYRARCVEYSTRMRLKYKK